MWAPRRQSCRDLPTADTHVIIETSVRIDFSLSANRDTLHCRYLAPPLRTALPRLTFYPLARKV